MALVIATHNFHITSQGAKVSPMKEADNFQLHTLRIRHAVQWNA